MDDAATKSKAPAPDKAEHDAYFPSPYSLSQYTSPKTDYDGGDYAQTYQGSRKRVIMIASDERYVLMQNGKSFSSGNHPVETLLPMIHLDKAGFDIEVTTLSGNSVKFELWAMPGEDKAVQDFYARFLPQFQKPRKLADVLAGDLDDVAAILVPGGHGALIGLPESLDVKDALNWALENDRFIVTLCHGPACLLAPAVDEDPEDYPFKGYEICVFPDSLDEGANIEIGYMPGRLPWLLADSLQQLGVTVLNSDISGAVHRDRFLLTGDSPLASNALGRLAAETMLAEIRD